MNRRKFSALLPASVALAGCQNGTGAESEPTSLEFEKFYDLMWEQVDYSAARAAERCDRQYRWDSEEDCKRTYDRMPGGNKTWRGHLTDNYANDVAEGRDPQKVECMPYFSHYYFQCAKLAGKKAFLFAEKKHPNKKEVVLIKPEIFAAALIETKNTMTRLMARNDCDEDSAAEIASGPAAIRFNACG